MFLQLIDFHKISTNFYFKDRDIQCDFENPFWEVNDCNWRQDRKRIDDLGYANGMEYQKLNRVIANEAAAGNYWSNDDATLSKIQ